MRVVDDPHVLFYILDHLGKDVPPTVPMFRSLVGLRERTLRKLLALPLPADLQEKVDKMAFTQHLDEGKEKQLLQTLAPQLLKASAEGVRAKLRDGNIAVRKLAIVVAAQRRLPLEEELIDLLEDPRTQESAHRALMRLSGGIDFGPWEKATNRDQRRSLAKWRKWLALQQTARKEMGDAKSQSLSEQPVKN